MLMICCSKNIFFCINNVENSKGCLIFLCNHNIFFQDSLMNSIAFISKWKYQVKSLLINLKSLLTKNISLYIYIYIYIK